MSATRTAAARLVHCATTGPESPDFVRILSAQLGVLIQSDALLTAHTRAELRNLQLAMELFADRLEAEAQARVPMRRVPYSWRGLLRWWWQI